VPGGADDNGIRGDLLQQAFRALRRRFLGALRPSAAAAIGDHPGNNERPAVAALSHGYQTTSMPPAIRTSPSRNSVAHGEPHGGGSSTGHRKMQPSVPPAGGEDGALLTAAPLLHTGENGLPAATGSNRAATPMLRPPPRWQVRGREKECVGGVCSGRRTYIDPFPAVALCPCSPPMSSSLGASSCRSASPRRRQTRRWGHRHTIQLGITPLVPIAKGRVPIVASSTRSSPTASMP
jgi:hypothetical protein